jgi:preprotein translocase subunit Sss1
MISVGLALMAVGALGLIVSLIGCVVDRINPFSR